jgi:hypothetical protein
LIRELTFWVYVDQEKILHLLQNCIVDRLLVKLEPLFHKFSNKSATARVHTWAELFLHRQLWKVRDYVSFDDSNCTSKAMEPGFNNNQPDKHHPHTFNNDLLQHVAFFTTTSYEQARKCTSL